jgi:Na+-transporting NADH:ubiquinone oxidoreductase subunit A
VGIQIHHVDPIRPGERVWVVNPQDVIIIGRLFTEGHYNPHRIVALTGRCVQAPQYYRMITGYRLSNLINGRVENSAPFRVIQGNVLTGRTSSSEDFLSAGINHITVIPESGESEFLGWASPGLDKLSLSRSYPSFLFPKKEYDLNTTINGELRPFVVTGQYDQVLPMNILPVYLLKAILAKDIEKMEKLGIYEVAEEDFALCEFVCTSKIEVQQIIREGLHLMQLEE